MEDTESTVRERATGMDASHEADSKVLMSTKPLHRFTKKEPRCLGIAIVIFGCAELLMGFQLANAAAPTSFKAYIPFWQGTLFLICGNLSIYTEVHPSKRMVTTCFAMYVVSLLGIIVSVGFRIYLLVFYSIYKYIYSYRNPNRASYVMNQLASVEAMLFVSSLCAFVLLVFLSAVARLSLRSTRNQVIVQLIPPPASNTAAN